MTLYNQIANNKFKTYGIIAIFIAIFSSFFYLIGKYYGSPTPYFLLGITISLLSSFGSYFFSDKIVLLTTRAHPADKKTYFNFYSITENLTMAAGIPMPKLYVIHDSSPNAFATGRDPKHAVVCVTTGLLELLDRTELEGVIAHELSHVQNYDILLSSLVAVLVGTVALIADWIMRSFWWGGFSRKSNDDSRSNKSPIFFILFVVVLIVTPIIATIIQLAVSRQREFLADTSGALLSRYPEGLARALEKISSHPLSMRTATSSTAHLFISNPFKKKNSGNWFISLFSTHPPIEERIKILRSI